jgi:hypothetical protein
MSKKTFMTSMTPDGKPGQVVEWVNDGEGEPVQSSAQQFAEPVPYNALSDAEVAALEKERKALTDSLGRLRDSGQRVKVEKRIHQIDVDLKLQRAIDEAKRRHQERAQERGPQQDSGDGRSAGNTQQVVNWSALDMATQTDLIQAAMKEIRRAGAV